MVYPKHLSRNRDSLCLLVHFKRDFSYISKQFERLVVRMGSEPHLYSGFQIPPSASLVP